MYLECNWNRMWLFFGRLEHRITWKIKLAFDVTSTADFTTTGWQPATPQALSDAHCSVEGTKGRRVHDVFQVMNWNPQLNCTVSLKCDDVLFGVHSWSSFLIGIFGSPGAFLVLLGQTLRERESLQLSSALHNFQYFFISSSFTCTSFTPPQIQQKFKRTSPFPLFLCFCSLSLCVCISLWYGFQYSVSATAHLADAGFHMIIQNVLCSAIV